MGSFMWVLFPSFWIRRASKCDVTGIVDFFLNSGRDPCRVPDRPLPLRPLLPPLARPSNRHFVFYNQNT